MNPKDEAVEALRLAVLRAADPSSMGRARFLSALDAFAAAVRAEAVADERRRIMDMLERDHEVLTEHYANEVNGSFLAGLARANQLIYQDHVVPVRGGGH